MDDYYAKTFLKFPFNTTSIENFLNRTTYAFGEVIALYGFNGSGLKNSKHPVPVITNPSQSSILRYQDPLDVLDDTRLVSHHHPPRDRHVFRSRHRILSLPLAQRQRQNQRQRWPIYLRIWDLYSQRERRHHRPGQRPFGVSVFGDCGRHARYAFCPDLQSSVHFEATLRWRFDVQQVPGEYVRKKGKVSC